MIIDTLEKSVKGVYGMSDVKRVCENSVLGRNF